MSSRFRASSSGCDHEFGARRRSATTAAIARSPTPAAAIAELEAFADLVDAGERAAHQVVAALVAVVAAGGHRAADDHRDPRVRRAVVTDPDRWISRSSGSLRTPCSLWFAARDEGILGGRREIAVDDEAAGVSLATARSGPAAELFAVGGNPACREAQRRSCEVREVALQGAAGVGGATPGHGHDPVIGAH